MQKREKDFFPVLFHSVIFLNNRTTWKKHLHFCREHQAGTSTESLHGGWRDMSCSYFNTQCNYSDKFLPLETSGTEVVAPEEKVS